MNFAFAAFQLLRIPPNARRLFYSAGVATLATPTHSTNTYIGTYRVLSNSVEVTIYYEDDITTQLELKRDGSVFTKIKVISDNDFVSPFLAIEFIRDILLDATKDDPEKEKIKSYIEKKLGKFFSDMNGSELACLFVSLEWLYFKD